MDLEGLDVKQIMRLKNEIFARYGQIFVEENEANYFGPQEWYHADHDDVRPFLSELEKKNIALIESFLRSKK